MPTTYTSGLTVAADTVVRKERRLPIAGQVLVEKGARVRAEDVVARAELPGDVATVNVVNLLGITPAEVMAIGDNLNDIGMVRWAGIGVMVGNGPDQALAAADWVAPSNNESGVAAAIERFLGVPAGTARAGSDRAPGEP